MNIVFLTAEFPYPPNSGGRIYTWQRIKYLSKHNKVFLFSIGEDEDFKYAKHLEDKEGITNVSIYKRPNRIKASIKRPNLPASIASRTSTNMKNDIKELIQRENIDIIIIDHLQMIENCPMDNSIPKVLSQHNIEHLTFKTMYKNASGIFSKLIYRREYKLTEKFEKKIYNTNDINLYTFISSDDKIYFEEKIKNKNTVLIPPGVNEITTKGKDTNKKRTIVFTGKMDYEPNIQAMRWFCEKIFPLIEKEIDDVTFYIVGKNPTEYIKSLSRENIIVTGEVECVDEYLNMAQVIVIPLLSGGGVKIKLMEALQNNNIVVSTTKGVEGTMFKHEIDLFVTDDNIDFANYCIDILRYPKKYNFVLKNARECIEKNYLWSCIGESYENSLRQIII